MTADICLQEGPQRLAAELDATVLVYGGGAGAGKTRFLVHEAAKYYDAPGYTAVIFRRTSPELRGPGGIWDETQKIYPALSMEPVESRLTWESMEGARIQLSHLQLEKDKLRWQGKELAFIGFDEATHFSEEQVWYLFSRLRTTCGVPTRMVLTCNPDPDSFLAGWLAWYLDDSGFPIPERSGVVRWFARVSGKLEWYDSLEVAKAAGHEGATSFAFVSALLWDNLILTKADPTYATKLQALPPIEQARLLGGNWKVRPTRGDYFQEQWFPHIPRTEIARTLSGLPKLTSVIKTWRAWDFAGTPVDGDQVIGAPQETHAEKRNDADWTRGWKFGLLPDGRVILLDLVSARDAPGAIEFLVRQTAEKDGRGCTVVIWQDPAQAGVHQLVTYKRLLRGFRFITCPTFNPLIVAKLASQQVFARKVLVPDGAPWLEEAMRELEGFPTAPHDDAVSALGLGVSYWLEMAAPQEGKALRPHEEEKPAAREDRRPARNDVKTTSRFREHF